MASVNKVLESEDKVDITPMIDIVFLLLVYFMFLPLQQEADVSIRLPSSTPPSSSIKLPNKHIIDIFPNGMIMLNGGLMDGKDDRVMAQLTKTLTLLKLSADRIDAITIVKIHADPDSPHQRSIDTLNACAKASITRVTFAQF